MCVCVCVCKCLIFCSLWPHGRNSPPGSSVHGIFQVGILQWVAISYSRGSFWPRGLTWVSCISHIGRQILYHRTTLEVQSPHIVSIFFFSCDGNFKSTILATFQNYTTVLTVVTMLYNIPPLRLLILFYSFWISLNKDPTEVLLWVKSVSFRAVTPSWVSGPSYSETHVSVLFDQVSTEATKYYWWGIFEQFYNSVI